MVSAPITAATSGFFITWGTVISLLHKRLK
jgi:hypothetical protein